MAEKMASSEITIMIDEFRRMGTTTYEVADAVQRLQDQWGGQTNEHERRKRQVEAARPFLGLLADPDVTFLRRSARAFLVIGPDGAARSMHPDVDPNWVVTFGVAVSITTREVEFWMSSPLSTSCWMIDVDAETIAYLTTETINAFMPRSRLESRWILELARGAEADEARFLHDPEPPPEPRPDIPWGDILSEETPLDRSIGRLDQGRWDWATPDWSKQRSNEGGLVPQWIPPGEYTVTFDDSLVPQMIDQGYGKKYVNSPDNNSILISDTSMKDNEYREITMEEVMRLKDRLYEWDKYTKW